MLEGDDSWQKSDLPEWLSPVITKELRQGLRRKLFLVPFVFLQLSAVIALVMEFRMGLEASEKTVEVAGVLNFLLFFPGSFYSGPFWVVTGLICVVLLPFVGLISMSQELEEGNHELLLMTPLGRWQVVFGKFFAIWGLCLLAFSSLLPYVVVRYFLGGIDVPRNMMMAGTVVFGSAIFVAGSLAVSAFHRIAARIGVAFLFLGCFILCGFTVLAAAAGVSGKAGIAYHLNALGLTACFVCFGLALARSRLRLTVHSFEVKPHMMLLTLLCVLPIIVGVSTVMTMGWAGWSGCVLMMFAAWGADKTPQMNKKKLLPATNIPGQAVLPEIVPAVVPALIKESDEEGKNNEELARKS